MALGFHVADVLTNNSRFMFHIYLCAMNEVTDIEMNRVYLLFECVLTRDGLAVLPCWFLSRGPGDRNSLCLSVRHTRAL